MEMITTGELQSYQAEDAKAKSARPLKRAVLEINRSDFLFSNDQMNSLLNFPNTVRYVWHI